ncbi:MAG: putative toxin-antitoxin system toxin component, PIN family [Chloroflexi bacterium]|nr:putative toxin-antitoxin system toxin component, PIN family [Chloroflexota bacterium]
MRVVVDTNVVVSRFLNPAGTPARVLALARANAFQLLASSAILEEYREALLRGRLMRRHGRSREEIVLDIERLRRLAVVVEPKTRLHVIAEDPSDNKFLECAVGGEADYIVSGDRHLLALGRYGGIEILSPAAFVMVAGRLTSPPGPLS